ncbi:hypothetical protein Tco_0998051 [Tanacetum coccineum]
MEALTALRIGGIDGTEKVLLARIDGNNVATRRSGGKKVQEREGFDPSQYKISVFAPEVKVVSIAEFFHRCVKKMVGGIRECDPVGYTKSMAGPIRLASNVTKGLILLWEGMASLLLSARNMEMCKWHLGSAPVVLFNNNFFKLSGYTAWELMEKYGMDPDEYWPGDGASSGSKKRRVVIYLDEIDSDPKDEGGNSNIPHLVLVKVEPED